MVRLNLCIVYYFAPDISSSTGRALRQGRSSKHTSWAGGCFPCSTTCCIRCAHPPWPALCASPRPALCASPRPALCAPPRLASVSFPPLRSRPTPCLASIVVLPPFLHRLRTLGINATTPGSTPTPGNHFLRSPRSNTRRTWTTLRPSGCCRSPRRQQSPRSAARLPPSPARWT